MKKTWTKLMKIMLVFVMILSYVPTNLLRVHAEEGSHLITVNYYYANTSTLIDSETREYVEGQTLTISVPQWESYKTYLGKYDETKNCWVADGSPLTSIETVVDEDKTLSFVYEEINYYSFTVSEYYVGSGSPFEIKSIGGMEGASVSITLDTIQGYQAYASIDENGDVVGSPITTVSVSNLAGDVETEVFYLANDCTYTVVHHFEGVKEDITETKSGKYGADTQVTVMTVPGYKAEAFPASKISNDTEVTVNYVFDKHLIKFDSNGGTFINPIEASVDDVTTLPTSLTKVGYTFAGWFTENGEKVESLSNVVEDTLLTAHWSGVEVNYTINYWKQKVTDAVNATTKTYDFAESALGSAVPGSKVSGTYAKSYMGFDNGKVDTNVEVKADGTTVVNVYYDRKVCTVNFYLYKNNKWQIDSTAKGLYAAPFTDWRTDYKWYTSYNKSDGSGSGAVLLTSYDFITAGYETNKDNVKASDGTVIVCNFYGTSQALDGRIYYYNEKADGSFELVETVKRSKDGTLTIHEKYEGYELYKYTTGTISGDPTKANFWTNKTNAIDGSQSSNQYIYIASKLKSYQLSYYNFNATAKTETVKYTMPLAAYASYTPERPAGLPSYYEFKGWYSDSACTTPFDFAKSTMPMNNLMVYAKWEPLKFNVNIHYNMDGFVDAKVENVLGGTKANLDDINMAPAKIGYTFGGWYIDNGFNTPFDPSMKIESNVDVYAKWTQDRTTPVVIHYVDEDGNTIHDNLTVNAVIGNPLTVTPLQIDGYTPIGANSSSETIESVVIGSEVTFVYRDLSKPRYFQVVYLDHDNGDAEVFRTSKMSNNYKALVTYQLTAPAGYENFLMLNSDQTMILTKVVADEFGEESQPVVYTVYLSNKEIRYDLTGGSYKDVYDGQSHTVVASSSVPNAIIEYYVNGTWQQTSPSHTDVTGGAKSYKVRARLGGYIFNNSGLITIEITPKPVTLSTDSNSWEYDGSEHGLPTVYGIDGFYPRDGITATASEKVKNAGESKTNSIVVAGSGLGNYTIEKTEGTISVYVNDNGVLVTITENSGVKTYNGESQSVTGYTVTSIEIRDGSDPIYTENDFQFTGTEADKTASGIDVGTYQMGLTASMFENTSNNFTNVEFTVIDGTLSINPKTVELSTDGHTWDYDGKEHSLPEISGIGGFYSRDKISATANTTVKFAGDNKVNAITVTSGTENGLANYDIKKSEGVLAVVKNQQQVVVTIVGNSDTVIYNGQSQHVTGYEITSIRVNGVESSLYKKSDVKFLGTTADQLAEGTDVDTYKMNLSAQLFANTNPNFDNDKVTFLVTNGSLTIDPKTVELSTDGRTWDYDGEEHSLPKVSGTDGFYSRDKISATASNTVKNAGDSKENTITVTSETQKGLANYNIKKTEGTLKVVAISDEVVVTIKENSDEKEYNGGTQKVTGYTVVSISNVLYTSEDFKFIGEQEVLTVEGTHVGEYEMKLTSKMFKNNNENFDNVRFEIIDGKLNITPATLTVVTDSAEKTYDGTALTADGELSGLLGEDEVTFEVTGSQTIVGESENTYSITWGNTLKTDYTIDETIGTLKVNEFDGKIIVTTTGGTFTYDGQAHGATVEVTYLENSPVMLLALTEESEETAKILPDGYTLVEASSDDTVTHVADGKIVADCDNLVIVNAEGEDVTDKLNIEFINGTLEIVPATLTVETESATKVYDGTALTAAGKVEGLVEGEEVTFTTTGSQTKVGTSNNTYLLAFDKNADASDYTVEEQLGLLEVTPISKEIVIEAASDSKVYDGTVLTNDGYTFTEDVLVKGDVLTATVEGSITDAGKAANKVTSYKVENAKGEDVTSCYTFANVVDGTLEVTPVKVVITSGSASKRYDGTPLTNEEITSEGFVGEDEATYTVTGSQTEVGTSENTFEYELKDGVNEGNYEIEVVFGQLTVEKALFTVTFNSGDHGMIEGGLESVSSKHEDGSKHPDAPAVDVEEGCQFDGWIDDATGEFVEEFAETVTEDKSYTARYVKVIVPDTDPEEPTPTPVPTPVPDTGDFATFATAYGFMVASASGIVVLKALRKRYED